MAWKHAFFSVLVLSFIFEFLDFSEHVFCRLDYIVFVFVFVFVVVVVVVVVTYKYRLRYPREGALQALLHITLTPTRFLFGAQ